MSNELYHYGTPKHSGRYPWGSGENPFHHGGSAPGWFKRKKKNDEDKSATKSDDSIKKNNKKLLDESISRIEDGLPTDKKVKNVKVKRVEDEDWRKGTEWEEKNDANDSNGEIRIQRNLSKRPDYIINEEGHSITPPRVKRSDEDWRKGTELDPDSKPQESDKKVENVKVKRAEDEDWRKGTEWEEKPELLALPAPKDQDTNFTYKPTEPKGKWESSSKQKAPNQSANKNNKSESKSSDKDNSNNNDEDAEKAKAKEKQAKLDKISGYRDLTSNAKSGIDSLGKIAQRVETNQALNARNQRFAEAGRMDDKSLDDAIKRMEKEQRFVNLTGNYVNKGRTSVSDVLATTGDVLATAGAVLGVAYTIKKLMD